MRRYIWRPSPASKLCQYWGITPVFFYYITRGKKYQKSVCISLDKSIRKKFYLTVTYRISRHKLRTHDTHFLKISTCSSNKSTLKTTCFPLYVNRLYTPQQLSNGNCKNSVKEKCNTEVYIELQLTKFTKPKSIFIYNNWYTSYTSILTQVAIYLHVNIYFINWNSNKPL